MPVQTVSEQIAGDVRVSKRDRKGITLIDDPPHGDVAATKVLMRTMFEITIGMRIVQGAMFCERFDKIASLNPVKQHVPAVICAVKQFSRPIKVEPPRVTSPFTKQFELASFRVVAPDPLLKFNSPNVGGHGDSLAAVQPAIRSPRQ